MAEVGRRLTGAANRLSAITGGYSRSIGSRHHHGSLVTSSTAADRRLRDKPRLEYKRKTSSIRNWTQLYGVRNGGNWTFLVSKCLEQESSDSRKSWSPQVCPSWSAARMTTWTRALLTPHHFSRSSEHLRTCGTFVFILAPGSALRRPTTVPCRTYSTRGDHRDAPMHRSRTAYYDVLHISPNATQSQIKTAYYKQSLIHHPDKNPGDPDTTRRFSVISEAYTVLGNIDLRRKYDRGLLGQTDVQSAGRPSSKAAPPHQRQQNPRQFYRAGGKIMYDFDAFYKGHYGEQLQREQVMRARKEMEKLDRERLKKLKVERMRNLTVMLVFTAGFLLVSLSRPL